MFIDRKIFCPEGAHWHWGVLSWTSMTVRTQMIIPPWLMSHLGVAYLFSYIMEFKIWKSFFLFCFKLSTGWGKGNYPGSPTSNTRKIPESKDQRRRWTKWLWIWALWKRKPQRKPSVAKASIMLMLLQWEEITDLTSRCAACSLLAGLSCPEGGLKKIGPTVNFEGDSRPSSSMLI